jgi:hypothetical protein
MRFEISSLGSSVKRMHGTMLPINMETSGSTPITKRAIAGIAARMNASIKTAIFNTISANLCKFIKGSL